jgi:hypothetical protein
VALLITFHLVVYDSFFLTAAGRQPRGWVGAYYDALNGSLIVEFFREGLLPTAGFLVRPFVPTTIARLLLTTRDPRRVRAGASPERAWFDRPPATSRSICSGRASSTTAAGRDAWAAGSSRSRHTKGRRISRRTRRAAERAQRRDVRAARPPATCTWSTGSTTA